jgi:protein TonB
MARADRRVILDARVPLALGVSLLLHGAALALADRLPLGGPRPAQEWAQWGVGTLHARLLNRAAEPAAAPAPPAAPGRAKHSGTGTRDSASSLPGAIDVPRYVPANELDERPQIQSRVEPAFPLDANAPVGRVVLRLLIGETGAVDKAVVVQADPPGPFEEAAVEAFAPARFSPGRKNGVAVRSALTLELRFGEPPMTSIGLRQQEVPLFQPPRQAPRRRSAIAQEKP